MNNLHVYGWLMDVIRIANTVEKFGNYEQCPYCKNTPTANESGAATWN